MVRLPPTQKHSAWKSQPRFEGLQTSAAQPTSAESQPRELPVPVQPEPRDEAPGMTLDEVTAIALANNPQIVEAQNQAAAARARALQASLYPNPTLGTASPQLAGDQSQYNAYVIQDLVMKGKIGLDASAAQRAACEAELAAVRARFDVLTTVRQRFYTALVAEERVKVLKSMVEIARSSLDVSERLFKAEEGTRSDVLQLRIEASRVEVDLKNALTLATTSKLQLAAATGLYDMTIAHVEGDLTHSMPDYEMIAVQRGVIARNSTARSAQVEIARSQIVLRRAQVEPFPNVNVMGGYQNQQPGAGAPQSQGMFQIQMVIPVWNRNQGNIRAAQAGVGTAVAQWNRVRIELANATAAALGRYETAQHVADRYERTVLPSAVELQEIAAQLYRQGQIDFLRYLNAQRALLDANLEYIESLESRWSAAAEVAGLLQSERFP
jgi:cobalt-zinc-cadmium efflux system outer membrane protein